MTHAIITTPNAKPLSDALRGAGVDVTTVDPPISTSVLEEARITDADLYILTTPDEATSIPIAREHNPDVRVVVYSKAGVPEFASHQADLVLSPGEIDREVIVEALLDTGES